MPVQCVPESQDREISVSDIPISQNCQRLIEEYQGLVRSLALRIHRKLPRYIDIEDLIAYGQVGLAEAARDFDPAQRAPVFHLRLLPDSGADS